MPDSLSTAMQKLEIQSDGLVEVIGSDIISQYTPRSFIERKRIYSDYF